MDKLYIVIPAYNETETIEMVCEQWHGIAAAYGEGSRLVIINDGSKDDTYDKLVALKDKYPYLEPVTKQNEGHGATCLYGYRYALDAGADYIFQTDSDGQTRPEEFPEFWGLREQYDMVIGHRNKRQDGFSRVFVTKVLKLVTFLIFGVRVTDANTPFRLMKREFLAECLTRIPEKFNLPNVLISVYGVKKKKSVKFIPITFKPRQGGVNSINLKKIFKIGKKAWHDFRIIAKNVKD
ncbi:MAG: glycosyltransferase family 2 protein [Clostridia bacterium]|nr:glycosyltransferase family 2 protein [Clostridia bacterium]